MVSVAPLSGFISLTRHTFLERVYMREIMQLPTHIDLLFQAYLNAKARYNMRLGTYDEMYDKHQVYLITYNEWLGGF